MLPLGSCQRFELECGHALKSSSLGGFLSIIKMVNVGNGRLGSRTWIWVKFR